MVTITLTVPASAAQPLQALAALLCTTHAPPPPPPPPPSPTSAIGSVIARYQHLPNGALQMARAANSRTSDLIVDQHGRWPVKSLYFLVMQILQPGRYQRTTEYHTQEAVNYFQDLGYTVRRS